MKTFMINALAKVIAEAHNKSIATVKQAILSQGYSTAQIESQYNRLVA